MKISNTTKSDLGLATGEIVPALGFLTITEEQLERNEGSAVVEHWFKSKQLIVGDPDPDQPDIPDLSRETIVRGAIDEVVADGNPDDMTSDNKPKTDPINVKLTAGGHEPTTSSERDVIWAAMKATE